MRCFCPPRIGVPACLLSAALLPLPEEASGQLESQRESLLLSAAIEEAKQGPFHRVDRAAPLVNAQTVETAARLLAAGIPNPFGHTPLSRETASRTDRSDDEPRHLILATALGIAVGDLIGWYLLGRDRRWLGRIGFAATSSSVTALAMHRAGVRAGSAFASSLLGTGLGVGTFVLVASELEGSLSADAILPAALAYYGVRLTVSVLTVKPFGSRD